eukprot:1767392-Rhodomonas_salina.1
MLRELESRCALCVGSVQTSLERLYTSDGISMEISLLMVIVSVDVLLIPYNALSSQYRTLRSGRVGT